MISCRNVEIEILIFENVSIVVEKKPCFSKRGLITTRLGITGGDYESVTAENCSAEYVLMLSPKNPNGFAAELFLKSILRLPSNYLNIINVI